LFYFAKKQLIPRKTSVIAEYKRNYIELALSFYSCSTLWRWCCALSQLALWHHAWKPLLILIFCP